MIPVALIAAAGLSACVTRAPHVTFISPTTNGYYDVFVLQDPGTALPKPVPSLLYAASVATLKAGYTHFKTSEPLDLNSKVGAITITVLGPTDDKKANLDFHVFDAAKTEVQYKDHALPASKIGAFTVIKAERCPGLESPVRRENRVQKTCSQSKR